MKNKNNCKKLIAILLLLMLVCIPFCSTSVTLSSEAKESVAIGNSTEGILDRYLMCYTVIDETDLYDISYAPELPSGVIVENEEITISIATESDAEKEKELDYEIEEVDEYDQYVTINLNIRSYPSAEDDNTVIDVANFASTVTVVGKVKDSSWVQIKYESDDEDNENIEYAFVSGNYLSDSKPEINQKARSSTVSNTSTPTAATYTAPQSSGCLSPSTGVCYGPSGKETYYNLNMDGVVSIMRSMGYDEANYPYWVREDGCKMFGSYIMVAANLSIRPKGTILPCSLGTAIVVDTGEFASADATQLDIATTW